MSNSEKYISGYFNDETDLKSCIKQLMEKQIPIKDVFTPFPVHGLEKILKYRRSHIPKIGFWGGAIGAAVGLGFQVWVFTKAWPLNFGGKPYFSLPSFIPVTFELAILFAAFSMVFAFFIRSGLGLGAKNKIYDEKTTDDRFLVVVDGQDESKTDEYKTILSQTGAQGIQVVN